MRGGRRNGAGRKAGAKTKRVREAAEVAAKGGMTPLQYMLAVVNNPAASEARRDAMAIASASYVHPKLAAMVVSDAGDRPHASAIRVEFVLPRGYSRDETTGAIIEHEPLAIERESETEH